MSVELLPDLFPPLLSRCAGLADVRGSHEVSSPSVPLSATKLSLAPRFPVSCLAKPRVGDPTLPCSPSSIRQFRMLACRHSHAGGPVRPRPACQSQRGSSPRRRVREPSQTTASFPRGSHGFDLPATLRIGPSRPSASETCPQQAALRTAGAVTSALSRSISVSNPIQKRTVRRAGERPAVKVDLLASARAESQ